MFSKRILILIPHPDDEVVGCAAAIARARAKGCRVFGLYLTDGVPVREYLWPWQRSSRAKRVRRRFAEAAQVAGMLGMENAAEQQVPTRSLKNHLQDSLDLIRATMGLVEADVLLVPAYEGGHADHDVANFLASRLQIHVPVWEFSEYHLDRRTVHANSFIENNGTEEVIQLTPSEQEAKRRLLKTYESERGNLNYVDCQQEAFRPLPPYDYTQPPHDGALWYQRYQWLPFRHPRVDFTQPEELCAAFAGLGCRSDPIVAGV